MKSDNVYGHTRLSWDWNMSDSAVVCLNGKLGIILGSLGNGGDLDERVSELVVPLSQNAQ